ncbi:MAG: adenosine deaminase [Candidatus Limnocylindria bacterium]
MPSADELHSLPKAELHQHLDGSMRPETAVELANAIAMPLDLDSARRRMVGPAHCGSQAQLLEFFDLPIALLQTEEALSRVTSELIEDMTQDGVRYAEVRWAPRLHLEGGLSVNAVLEAVASGIARAASAHGADMPLIGLIVTAMRSDPPAANVQLARSAADFGPPIIGFDLAGPELAWPAPPHAAAFNAARDGGLALTAHAGEIAGAQRVREVLEFGVRRIGHGVTVVEDATLVQLLRARDITLDLCPTSNVQARVIPDLSSHPIAALHRAGVSVTISTDERTVTGISLSAEMARTASAVGLTDEELASIALNGFARAFAPPTIMAPMRAAAVRAWSAWLAGSAIS